MLQATFRTLQSRHPLARFFVGALGVVAVLLVITLGMFALAALAIGGFAFVVINALRGATRSAAQPAKTPPPPAVIEGEFRVVSDPARAANRPSQR